MVGARKRRGDDKVGGLKIKLSEIAGDLLKVSLSAGVGAHLMT